jgi:two-component system nitrate/nitrite sensor histidine kinase NarX
MKQQPVADTGILARIAAELAGGEEPTALLRRFLAPMVQVCGADAGAMRVRSADGRRFELVGDLGLPATVRAEELSVGIGCGVCGLATSAREVSWTDDLASCVRRNHVAFFGAECQRVLAVPLVHRGRVLGLCNLFFASGADVAPQTLALLRTIGELLGLALHGAQLERDSLAAAMLAERQLLAAEVHDSIAQTLTYAKMRLPLLDAAVAAGDRAAALRYSSDLRHAVGDAHAGLREVLTHLRAPGDPGGFRQALQASRSALQEAAELELAVQDHAPDLQLTPLQDHQVHRIVQEALRNIVRHAGARRAWLTIKRLGGDLQIVVDDDGQGLAQRRHAAAGFGLGIMRQRAALLGGAIRFEARRQGGTRMRLRFPLAWPTAPARALQR